MESLALLPSDLAAFVDPMARPAAARQAGLDVTEAALTGPDAFAQFLSLFAPVPAGGQELPASGNSLPFVLPDSAAEALELGAESAADAAPADLIAAAELAVGLPLRSAPAVATIEVPLDPHTEPFPRVPIEPRLAHPSLGAALPPTASLSSEPQLPSVATAETLSTGRSVGSLMAEMATAEAPPLAPEASVAATRDAETFDALARGDALPDSARLRADIRATAPAPAAPPTSPEPAVALRLAPMEPGAVSAALRTLDVDGMQRTPRTGDAVAPTGAMAAFSEISSISAAESPPVAVPTLGAPQATATVPTSTPVTVLEAPVDTRGPQWQESLAGRVQWLVDQKVGEARIKLNPPELGAVDVKISLVEDKTYVQLTAATAAARDELAQSLPRLRELFTASGLELSGASVQGGRGGQPGTGGGSGYESAARYLGDAPALDPLLPAEPARLAPRRAGAIDTFA